MKPGPRPRPTKLTVLTGETRPSRINTREPQVPEGEPVAPETLSPAAARVWQRTVERLRGSRVLTPADSDPLAVYCEHVVSHAEMVVLLRRSSYMLRGTHGNATELVKNPLVAMIRNEGSLIRAFAVEFGLTPSARTGLVTPSENPTELERLLS